MTYVHPKGSAKKYIIVAEQPGRQEVKFGEPLVGPAGMELWQNCSVAGINRTDCYVTNVVKEWGNPVETYLKNKKLTQEGIKWQGKLRDELSPLNPDAIIIALGGLALKILTGRDGIDAWAGSYLDSLISPHKVIPSIHPARIIPPKNQYPLKWVLTHDLKRARMIQEGTIDWDQYEIITQPTYKMIIDFLDYAKTVNRFAYDLEVAGQGLDKQISCFSISIDHSGMSIPLIEPDKHGGYNHYLTPPQESEVFCRVADLFENVKIEKVGQNLCFDNHFMFRRYGIRVRNILDTMVAQQMLMGDLPKGLDMITHLWTTLNYYKGDGKEFITGKSGNWESFWAYNALDSIVCEIAIVGMEEQLDKMDMWPHYKAVCESIEPLTFMQEYGIKIDLPRMMTMEKEKKEEVNQLTNELLSHVKEKTTNPLFNAKLPNSPKQMQEYFWNVLGAKKYKGKSGKFSTDDDALKRYIAKGYPEAGLVRDIRGAKKIASNYLNPDKVDPDGRIRCFYNPAGTRFSRLSSSKTIFGTGMNLQNWPIPLRSVMVPDEGCVFISLDLSQVENRIVAYVARESKMIEAFENGLDVHALTGALISGKSYEKIKEEADDEICASMGHGNKTWRAWGKNTNHGLNYGLGYKKAAMYWEIMERDAKILVEKYHTVYPGVRMVFHGYVQQQLRKTRTIKDLLGRTYTYFGKLDTYGFQDMYPAISQGTVGTLMTEVLNRCYANEQLMDVCNISTQTHDDLAFQFFLNRGWEAIAKGILTIRSYMEKELTTPHGLSFQVPADMIIGLTYGKKDGIELKGPEFPYDRKTLAMKLEDVYSQLKK